MNTYHTGLFAVKSETETIRTPKGAGWYIGFVQKRKHRRFVKEPEVLIKASSQVVAQRALDLILCSLALYSGQGGSLERDMLAYNDREPDWLRGSHRKIVENSGWMTVGIPQACAIAAKASRSKRAVYAITKYHFSVSLYSVCAVDLEPHSSEHLPVSQLPQDHVIFSYAIIAAHSAIEDVGLEIRASKKKPSRINGKWNPVVKLDLESRLRNAGIDIDNGILWTVRSSNRKIEKKRPLPTNEKFPWAYGKVRDCEVQIIDAIAYVDWLRDCVASHATKDLTKKLSPYDVVNVQHLTRRLILEKLGWWKVMN